MEDITAPTISLKDAAAAVGFKSRWLRDLVGDSRILLLGQTRRQSGGWNRAAPVDVFRLAMLRRFLDSGFSLSEAIRLIDLGVDLFLSGLAGCGIAVPSSVMLERLAGQALHIGRDDPDDEPDVFFSPTGEAPGGDYAITMTFDLGAIAADSLGRVATPIQEKVRP